MVNVVEASALKIKKWGKITTIKRTKTAEPMMISGCAHQSSENLKKSKSEKFAAVGNMRWPRPNQAFCTPGVKMVKESLVSEITWTKNYHSTSTSSKSTRSSKCQPVSITRPSWPAVANYLPGVPILMADCLSTLSMERKLKDLKIIMCHSKLILNWCHNRECIRFLMLLVVQTTLLSRLKMDSYTVMAKLSMDSWG